MVRVFFIGYFIFMMFFFFSSRRRHTRLQGDWSSDVCSSDLEISIASQRSGEPRIGEVERDLIRQEPRPRHPAMTGLATHHHMRLGPLGYVREMLLVDVFDHVYHHPRRALWALVVCRELEGIERRSFPPNVAVGAAHAEPQSKAPHGGDQLLLTDRFRQNLQVCERIGWKLSLRWERGPEEGGHDGETDDVTHRGPGRTSRGDIASTRGHVTGSDLSRLR